MPTILLLHWCGQRLRGYNWLNQHNRAFPVFAVRLQRITNEQVKPSRFPFNPLKRVDVFLCFHRRLLHRILSMLECFLSFGRHNLATGVATVSSFAELFHVSVYYRSIDFRKVHKLFTLPRSTHRMSTSSTHLHQIIEF